MCSSISAVAAWQRRQHSRAATRFIFSPSFGFRGPFPSADKCPGPDTSSANEYPTAHSAGTAHCATPLPRRAPGSCRVLLSASGVLARLGR